jgi:hypothetical protein
MVDANVVTMGVAIYRRRQTSAERTVPELEAMGVERVKTGWLRGNLRRNSRLRDEPSDWACGESTIGFGLAGAQFVSSRWPEQK